MNKDKLLEQLRQSENPTVVDFWAPWCVPCRRIKPVLDQLAQEYDGRVNFQAINADEQPELMREMRVFSIPTLMVVDKDKKISRMMGAQLFESLATEQELTSMPISNRDRFLRLGIGAVLVMIAWMYATWWLLPIGLAVMFWGVYDRCPIWQAISTRFKPRLE